jgi:predicted outer membrane repeat protein
MKRFLNWLTGARRARSLPIRAFRPRLENLETRQLLSTFNVVLATDGGGPGGQMVTATSGDLRYCIAQADAVHAATSDTITFDPTLFATPQNIALNSGTGTLVLSDSIPLTIQGPTGRTATVSGGDAIEILDITGGTVNISNLAISHGHTSSPGGGVSNSGTLTLTNCILDHDVGSGGGGGLCNNPGATAKLVGCTLTHDSAFDGGGIYANGKLTLTNCTFSNDFSSGVGGGGVWISYGCKATVTGCKFSNDSTNEDGGAVFVVGNTTTPTTATFGNCILSNDFALNGGGGLCTDGTVTVKMTTCTISDDTAGQGGGVCNSGGTVVLTQCTLSNDSCPQSGGGGGFENGAGTGTVTACTFSNDSAYAGGGMYNRGPATVSNCTFSNNTARAGGGGAIYNVPLSGTGFTLDVTNCTIANNSAVNNSGGGIYNVAGTTLNLTNTIAAENTATSSGPDVFGVINTADHNLIGDGGGMSITTDQGGNLVGGNGNPVIDPRLGPLQNNGGTTQTLALLADSPAIGQADNAKAPTTDQRGHKRVDQVGEVTDIGAFEYP